MSRHPLAVVITPHLGDANPYAKMLATALEEREVRAHLWQSRRVFPLLRAAFRCGLPDVVHLQRPHGYFAKRRLVWSVLSSAQFWLEWLLLKVVGVQFVWTVHNIQNHEKVHSWWELMMSKLLARAVDTMIVHCGAAIPLVAAAYGVRPEGFRIVPLGHYADWYPPPLERGSARARLGLPGDSKIALFFGLVRAYKGVDQLLDAVRDLRKADLTLVVVGRPHPPSLGDTLQVLARQGPGVRLRLERVSDEVLTEYISACDFVVLPYRDILTSAAIMLAASLGRAAVAPRLACMGEFPDDAAILYEPGDPDGLKSALARALDAPLVDMGSAARRYVMQFPWSLVAEKTIEVYEEVLRRAP